RCAGRVEVKHQGQWGTVCSYLWDMKDADVVCRQLGCGYPIEAHSNAHFGPGSGPVWMSHVDCDGSESALSDYRHRREVQEICSHAWDAGVTCSGTGTSCSCPLWLRWGKAAGCSRQVRLAEGRGRCQGRVEIYYQGSWGSVCDDSWDLPDASVVCQQLGCG
ncbi:DMBT1 protein, partial [Tricholaema leucomelas]|nr:DMBT1 protein [Tricholaema leucomelas]